MNRNRTTSAIAATGAASAKKEISGGAAKFGSGDDEVAETAGQNGRVGSQNPGHALGQSRRRRRQR